jgi:hypothetical protein
MLMRRDGELRELSSFKVQQQREDAERYRVGKQIPKVSCEPIHAKK